MKGHRWAFTLIELLVVVGIIAILAAIALPNLLESQTRAKVSRAQADLRTVSVALEAYVVDHNKYPLPANLDGSPITPYPSGGPHILGTRLGVSITTPIAYLSSRPDDPFPDSATSAKLTFHYNSRDYAVDREFCTGNESYNRYVKDLLGSSRDGIQYVLVSNGPDLDYDLANAAPAY